MGRRISEKNSVPDDAAALVEKQLRTEETSLGFHVPTGEHQPEEETADLQFADMFNLEDVQAIQDAFANATGVASVIVDVNGTPITRPSNFSRLCAMIHATAQGAANCRESDAAIGKRITENSLIHPCLSAGLWDGGSKIYIGNRHVASWLAGQVLDDQCDEERIVQYGRDIGIDEAEFREALRHVVRMSREQFERVCRALHLVAQQLSNLALQNIRQKQEITRRVKAEKSLQESREQLRLFAEASFEGISILEDGIIVDVNEQYLKMHQYSREELIGRPLLSIIAPRSRQIVAEAIRSDNLGPYQLWSCRKDGTEVLVEVRARILHVGNRKLRLSAVRDITDYERVKEALRASERRLRQVIDLVPHCIYAKDAEGRFVLANKATAETWGTPVEGMIGKTNADFARTEDEVRQFRSADLHVMEKGVALNVSEYMIDARGNRRDFLSTKMPFLWSESSPPGVLGVSIDVTEQKRKEELLRASEERARLLVDATYEGICITENGYFVDVNERYLSMTGYRRDELIGTSVFTIVPPHSQAVMAHAIQFDSMEPYEHFLRRKDGQEVLFEARPRIFYSEGRKLRLTAVRDITEQKRYEENLRQAKEDWERTFNTVPDLIAILDANYRIIRVNHAMAQQLGVTLEQAVGLLCYECVHGTSRPPDYCPHAQSLKDKEQRIAEVHEPHLGGDYVVSVTPLKNQQGEVVGSIHVARNVTAQKKAEEALRQAQKMESLGVLAGGIAHDFNNLLQIISGQVSLALSRLPESFSGRSNIEKAQLAAIRAADLTRQLLAYSGRGKFQIKVVELNSFIHDTLHLLEIAVPKNVTVRLELAHLPLYFRADVAQTQQVLLNLVINGAEAMAGNSGTITIRTYRQLITEEEIPSWKHGDVAPRPGAFIVLEVEDTGQGMDQATMEKIFDPFFTTKFTGRGLGLSAVLGIIRGHGGGLQVESALHVGTRFRIAFPQVVSSLDAPVETVPAPADRAHGTILFIDDEEFLRELFVDAFDHSSIRVLTAKDGEEGIALFRQHRQDVSLIVLDLSMPGMGGEAAFRELRKISPHVKIILSSGYAEEDIMNKFKDLNVTGFIPKPYPWNRLDQLLNKHLHMP